MDKLSDFLGFNKPEANFFKLPNEWTDITAGLSSLAEIKVVEYVLRHTWGFQEFDIVKKITLDEFMSGRKGKDDMRMDRGTGLSKQGVITGIALALEHGLLEVETDDTDKARIKKYYKLRMSEDRADVKSFDTGVNNLDSSGQEVRHRTEKETKERNKRYEKKTNEDEVTYYAGLIADKLNDNKSLSYYRLACRQFPPHILLEKATTIVTDGGARKPGAVFVDWLKTYANH